MSSSLESIHNWYESLGIFAKATIRAVPVAIAAYCTALLESKVGTFLDLGVPFGSHAIILMAAIVFIVAVYWGVLSLFQRIRDQRDRKEIVLANAYSLLDSWIGEQIVQVEHYTSQYPSPSNAPGDHDALDSLKHLVVAIYKVLESHFSKIGSDAEKIDFEVTFMTKCYDDDHLTILAWANRDSRSPQSLILRSDNPKIYERTETSKVYADPLNKPRIVESTDSPESDFDEVYTKQRDRIRSMLCYPIKSGTNQLLGTVVLHCDRDKFFKHGSLKFWKEFLEVFAKRIALEKLRLDYSKRPLLTNSG